jgi:hypothetical protein
VCTIRQKWFFCSLRSPNATTIVIIEFSRSDVNDSFGTKGAPIESYSIIGFLRRISIVKRIAMLPRKIIPGDPIAAAVAEIRLTGRMAVYDFSA